MNSVHISANARIYRYTHDTYILCTNNNNINERPVHRCDPSSIPQRWKNTIRHTRAENCYLWAMIHIH
jgi:hypothetical protein